MRVRLLTRSRVSNVLAGLLASNGVVISAGLLGLAACGSDSVGEGTPIAGMGGNAGDGEGPAGGSGGAGASPTSSGGTPTIFSPEGVGGSQNREDEVCVGEEANSQPIPAIVELLVDTSTSMNQTAAGGGGGPTKWEETRTALLDALGLMTDTTQVGLVFYPDVGGGAASCFDEDEDVPIGLLSGSEQRDKLSSAFASQAPSGSTPTHDAYVYALERLESFSEPGERFVVLITDGEPTFALGCQGSGVPNDPADPAPLIPEAAQALSSGIKTFVIGSPGSEGARESLSQMAEAGGTGPTDCSHEGPNFCHFDMTEEPSFSEALSGALAEIAGQTLTCAYDVPDPPSGERLDLDNLVNVFFTESGQERELLPRAAEGVECTDGWQYTEDRSRLVLCPATCSRIQALSGELSLEFGCESRIPY